MAKLKSTKLSTVAHLVERSTGYKSRNFPTFLKFGPGPVEIGEKAFEPSKLGNLMQL